MKFPRLVLAGTHSGVGKTIITSGIMQALNDQGLRVQGFKVGPDYIDPSYHTQATNRTSRNLDTWMLDEKTILELMPRAFQNADIAIIEGVMGFYDGFGGNSDLGSTAHIAKVTKSPVILIIDTRSMARSIAALVYGFKNFDPDVNLAGIILNKVASLRHLEILKEALEPLNIPVLGHLFRDTKLGMPERHLGLIPAIEREGLTNQLSHIAQTLKNSIDLSGILSVANSAQAFPKTSPQIFKSNGETQKYKGLKIGYAYDQAFSFYYRDGLDLLEHYGVELVPFSPLEASKLPAGFAGIIIGGGFPELYLKQLSANKSFMESLREAHSTGLPIYAECGGFMYLTEEIIDSSQKKYKMVGLVPGKSIMINKLVAMGYREGMTLATSLLGSKGTSVKGHEFHYSRFEPNNVKEFPWAYRFNNGKQDGYIKNNLIASYLHVHFLSNPQWARCFLNKCLEYFEVKK